MYEAESGGPAFSGGQRTEYDFDLIRRLATSKGDHWADKARSSHHKVKQTGLTADSFSDIASCRTFGRIYEAAYDVYVATLEGVQQDVKAYQDKLLAVAQHMEDRDHRAESVFAGFATGGDTLLHSNQNYEHQTGSDEAVRAEELQSAAREAEGDPGVTPASAPSATETSGAAAVTDGPPAAPPAGNDGGATVQASQDPYAEKPSA